MSFVSAPQCERHFRTLANLIQDDLLTQAKEIDQLEHGMANALDMENESEYLRISTQRDELVAEQRGYYREYVAYMVCAEVANLMNKRSIDPDDVFNKAHRFVHQQTKRFFNLGFAVENQIQESMRNTVRRGIIITNVLDRSREIFQDILERSGS